MSQTNDENERTLFCGNVHDKVTEELLYELFLQVCVGDGLKYGMERNSGTRCNWTVNRDRNYTTLLQSLLQFALECELQVAFLGNT